MQSCNVTFVVIHITITILFYLMNLRAQGLSGPVLRYEMYFFIEIKFILKIRKTFTIMFTVKVSIPAYFLQHKCYIPPVN